MTFRTELSFAALVGAIALLGACASADETKYTASMYLVGGETLIMPLQGSKADCERTQSLAASQARAWLKQPENAGKTVMASECVAITFTPVKP